MSEFEKIQPIEVKPVKNVITRTELAKLRVKELNRRLILSSYLRKNLVFIDTTMVTLTDEAIGRYLAPSIYVEGHNGFTVIKHDGKTAVVAIPEKVFAELGKSTTRVTVNFGDMDVTSIKSATTEEELQQILKGELNCGDLDTWGTPVTKIADGHCSWLHTEALEGWDDDCNRTRNPLDVDDDFNQEIASSRVLFMNGSYIRSAYGSGSHYYEWQPSGYDPPPADLTFALDVNNYNSNSHEQNVYLYLRYVSGVGNVRLALSQGYAESNNRYAKLYDTGVLVATSASKVLSADTPVRFELSATEAKVYVTANEEDEPSVQYTGLSAVDAGKILIRAYNKNSGTNDIQMDNLKVYVAPPPPAGERDIILNQNRVIRNTNQVLWHGVH